MVVTIHQPNFMPWYPFFQKMASADVFVLLTHCQFEKNGYQNRFQIRDQWYTMRVHHGLVPIAEKNYVDAPADWSRISRSLPEYGEILRRFDDCISGSLVETNSALITGIARELGIGTKIVRDVDTGLSATERLVALCREHAATHYISGVSGKHYLDLSLFEKAGIEVVFQDESHMDKRPILEVLKTRGNRS